MLFDLSKVIVGEVDVDAVVEDAVVIVEDVIGVVSVNELVVVVSAVVGASVVGLMASARS